MARNRALSLVRAREIASTHDFAEAGVSRQSVSRFCKDGLIQRVRHGWYRAAPLLPRNASAARLHG
ncbi:type IV toxin-antitoxin system AbiEi family antitoxin domain-containing protein [Sphingomonas sp. VDB2]